MENILQLYSITSIKLQELQNIHLQHNSSNINSNSKSLALTDFSFMDFNSQSDNYFYDHCLTSFDNNQDSLQHTLKRVSLQIIKKPQVKGCICKKTKCIKMYCQCFSQGKICSTDCVCFNCSNTEQNNQQREAARKELMYKKQRLNQVNQGCNCQRSNCKKRYCECFQSGKHCGEYCKCNSCQNINEQEKSNGEDNQLDRNQPYCQEREK